MTLLGNQDTGLGNVDTAGQVADDGGGGPSSSLIFPANIWVANQLAAFNGNFVHPLIFCDCLSGFVLPHTAVDWQTVLGTAAANSLVDPSTVTVTAVTATGNSLSSIGALGLPAIVPNTKRMSFYVGGRLRVNQWVPGAPGRTGIVLCMSDGTRLQLSVNDDISDDFFSLAVLNPSGAVASNATITSLPVGMGNFRDIAFVWDTITVTAFAGDRRLNIPLTPIGSMEDGNLLQELQSTPLIESFGGGEGSNSCDCDYFYAGTVLTP